MSHVVVHRPARTPPPRVPGGEVVLLGPPTVHREPAGAMGWLQYVLPAAGGLGSILFVITNPRPLYIVGGLLFALSAVAGGVAMHFVQSASGRQRTERERERYLAYLGELRGQARETARMQHLAATWRHPDPAALWTVAESRSRLWERRPGDDDFLSLRVGRGPQPLATPLSLGSGLDGLADTEPVSTSAARRLVDGHRWVDGQPIALDLRSARVVSVVAPRETGRALVRALLCQLAALHAPDEVGLALVLSEAAVPEWDWCKWLPHLRPEGSGGLNALIAGEVDARRRAATREEAPPLPALVAVADGPVPGHDAVELLRRPYAAGVSLVVLADTVREEPPAVDVRVRVDPGGALQVEPAGDAGECVDGRADLVAAAAAAALARRLAPLRLSPEAARRPLAGEPALLPMLGIADAAALDPAATWRPRPRPDLMRVPVGVEPDGEPLVLDLKEPALGGDGPHGVVVGATGSGKSELLRTLVTALAATHPPEILSFVLVDFKGGAAFAGLADLPHVAGLITNLADDLALVDRMAEALFGEQRRRQELLRRAGNLPSLHEYHRRRSAGGSLERLPYLLLIVDEFAELLTAKPEFIDLFVAFGRLGRSLGMHLLLASQQLDEGRLRGLEGHLSYRIALRTFSGQESRAVIGTEDAYHLPRLPGSGYLKVGTTVFKRFRAALVSKPYEPPGRARERPAPRIVPFLAGGRSEPAEPVAALPAGAGDEAPGQAPSVLDVVVRRLREAAPRAHQVWLPPLQPALPLDRLLGPLAAGASRGLQASGWPGAGRLAVPLGLVDRPAEQACDTLVCDLSGAAGHLAIVGAPQSGKSTLLRTLVAAFALTHTPAEARFYCVDLGGGGLAPLEALPHVGGVTGRHDPERVRRTVAQVAAMLDEREHRFRRLGIDSAQAMRARRGTEQGCDDVFLCIDNWPALRQDFEDLEGPVHDIATRGLGCGVHLVLTAGRWMDIRPALLDSLGGRLELRLNDPADSAVDRRAAANVPAAVPGRGLTAHRLHFQAALPRVDGSAATADLHGGVEELVARVAAGWSGPRAAPVRMLPGRVLFTDLPAPGAGGVPGVPVGISEVDLGPVFVDPAGAGSHFVVFGDGESGKTTLLRTFLLGLAVRQPPAMARVLLVDYRRTLLGAVPPGHLLGYAGGAAAAGERISQLAGELAGRLPGADLPVEDLRRRSWWTGPEIYVVVDDYDLVATMSDNPLMPLLDFLPQSRDVGLHLLVARRVGGAARALFEPVLQGLRELGSPGILLSGDPQEGPLLGDRSAMPLPPGRGVLVRRGEAPVLVQVAWTPPDTVGIA